MAPSYIKICSTSLIIKKMEIKTTEYHRIPFRLAISKKIRNSKFWQGYGVKETLVWRPCSVNIHWFSRYGNCMEVLQKI